VRVTRETKLALPFALRTTSDEQRATLPLRHRLSLAVQWAAGRCTVFVYAPLVFAALRWGMGYRVHDLPAVRRRVRDILATRDGPLLICPNHLTMIDSAIVAWALLPTWRYLFAYHLLPWNLPEATNFAHPLARAFCYLAKCLPVVRGGSRGAQQTALAKCAARLRRGDLALVFPEGRRSRSGAIDPQALADGVGRLVKAVPGCRVLCVYLRGDGQAGYSTLPRRGERFFMDLDLITPRATAHGVRGSREIAAAIVAQLAVMERRYHAHRQ
jgi:hypothetical protein